MLLALIILLSGCVINQFMQVAAGPVVLQNLTVGNADDQWNRAPQMLTGYLHKGSELWTRDGIPLDRLIIFPGIENGGTLFKSLSKDLVYPAYQAGMLPNEITELTQSTLVKFYGGDTLVNTAGLRPHALAAHRAVMFDLDISSAENPRIKGRALAFVEAEQLYLMLFMAAEIHYFDEHWEQALRVMESAKVATTERT